MVLAHRPEDDCKSSGFCMSQPACDDSVFVVNAVEQRSSQRSAQKFYLLSAMVGHGGLKGKLGWTGKEGYRAGMADSQASNLSESRRT